MLKSSRGWQTFIVNGRIISNKAIAKAIDNAYHSLLPKSGFPLAELEINVPQRTIDVNVHPQKSEMKFEDEGRIFKAVYKTIVDAIRPAGQTLKNVAAEVEHVERHYTMEPMHFVPAAAPAPAASGPAMPAAAPRTIYEAVHRPASAPAVSFAEAQAQLQQERQTSPRPAETAEVPGQTYAPAEAVLAPAQEVAEQPSETSAEALAYEGSIVPIGQVDLCYIIAQDAKGLYIVDQHAAHERILYDKFSAMAESIPSQQLLVHQLLDFDHKETELIEQNQELFRTLGFDMEACGENEFRLKEVPADIPAAEAEDIIREILTSLHDMHALTAQEIRHACLATTACRAAIKAGDELNLRQMQIILEELSHTARPYTCPHGRPTILKFSSDELAKMFKRTGF